MGLHAATITWANTAGGNWSVAANWNPHQVPTNTDTALITTPGTYTVTFDFNANPSSFYPAVTLGAGGGAAGVQTLAVANVTFSFTNLMVAKGGVFTANGAHVGQVAGQSMTITNGGLVNCTNSGFYSAVLVANGGTFSGLGNDSFNSSVTVASGGVFNDATVILPQGATAMVTSGGTMNLTAPSGSYGVLDGLLVNSGTINFTNGGFLLAYNMWPEWTGGILNQPGGKLNLNGSVSFEEDGLSSAGLGTLDTTFFTNNGTLTQVSGGGTSDFVVGSLDNSQGTVTNLSGTLSLGNLRTNFVGAFSTASGAVIQLNFLDDGATITVPGSPLVVSGSGVQFSSGILYYASNTVPNLGLGNGLLILGPAFQGGSVTNLTLDGISLSNSVTVTGQFNSTGSPHFYGNVTVASGGQFHATGGYLHGNVTVASSGALFATNVVFQRAISVASGGSAMIGSCYFEGPVNISAGAGLMLNGTSELDAGLTNSGSVMLNSATIIVANNPSYGYFGGIQNQPGGMINLTGSGTSMFYAYGPEYFQNRGAITQNSPGGTNSITMPNFVTAQGTITNLAGTLLLAAFQTNLAGMFDAAPGAVIQISGGGLTGTFMTATVNPPLVPGTPLTLAGGGQFQFIGSYQLGQFLFTGGYLLLPTDAIPNLALQGGILQLGAGFQGGAITNLTIGGMTLTNTLPVTGQFTATNSPLYGNFAVASGGKFNCAATLNGLVSIASGGLMSVTNSAGTTVNSSGALTVANGGQINIIGNSGINLFGALTNAGTLLISNPNPLSVVFSNTVIYFPAGISIYNNPAYNYFGSVLNLPSGQINLATDYTRVSGSYGYETLVNQGRITKSAGTNFCYITVALATNAGAITSQSGVIRAYPIAMLTGSSLNVGINSANNYGSFLFSTNVVLGGAFNATLNNGYVPANGTAFNVLLSYSGVLGTFSSLGLPPAVTWQPTYGSTNFTLVVGSAKPQFGTFNLSGTNLIFNGIGGSPGSNYVVLASTNLTLPLANWSALTTNTFDGTGQFHYTNHVTPAKPRQFFIFKLP
jgi:hypothetical protein